MLSTPPLDQVRCDWYCSEVGEIGTVVRYVGNFACCSGGGGGGGGIHIIMYIILYHAIQGLLTCSCSLSSNLKVYMYM